MAKDRAKKPRLRLFFALDLPDAVVEEIILWQGQALYRFEHLRLLSDRSMHATLVFLGYQYERDVEKIVATAKAAIEIEKAVPARFGGLVPVPPKRPRLYALSVDDSEGVLAELQGKLSRKLSDAGFYREERRPFWPHITVARQRRSSGGRKAGGPALERIPELPERLRKPFSAVRVSLYSSKLRPEGAVYRALAHFELEEIRS